MAGKKRHLIRVAVIYLASIFVFAAVYYFNWIINTSSFIVNNEYNESTVDIFSLLERNYSINISDVSVPFSIDKMNAQMTPFFNRVRILHSKIAECENTITVLKQKEDTVVALIEKNYDQNLNHHLANRIKPLSIEKDSLQIELAKCRTRDSTQTMTLDKNDFEITAARLDLALANLNYEIAKLTSETYSEGLKQRLNYIDGGLIEQSDQVNAELLNLYHRSSLLNDSLLNTRSNIYNLVNRFHQNRINKVRFVDLVYFSVVTATSTGYGDIIPNNRLIRIITTVQILFSLTIFGVFLTHVTRKPG